MVQRQSSEVSTIEESEEESEEEEEEKNSQGNKLRFYSQDGQHWGDNLYSVTSYGTAQNPSHKQVTWKSNSPFDVVIFSISTFSQCCIIICPKPVFLQL